MGDTGEIGLREHISNTRHQWPKHRIVREYDEQQEALRLSLAAMKAVEWEGDQIFNEGSSYFGDPTCPSCAHPEGRGHAPDCQLAGAINRVEGVLGE